MSTTKKPLIIRDLNDWGKSRSVSYWFLYLSCLNSYFRTNVKTRWEKRNQFRPYPGHFRISHINTGLYRNQIWYILLLLCKTISRVFACKIIGWKGQWGKTIDNMMKKINILTVILISWVMILSFELYLYNTVFSLSYCVICGWLLWTINMLMQLFIST